MVRSIEAIGRADRCGTPQQASHSIPMNATSESTRSSGGQFCGRRRRRHAHAPALPSSSRTQHVPTSKKGHVLPHPIFTILIFALSLLILVLPASASYSVVVNDGTEECFVTRTPKEGGRYIVSGNYDLLDDGVPSGPLSVALYNHKMKSVYQSRFGRSEDTFSVVSTAGERFMLCIKNGFGLHKGRLARSDGEMDDDDETGGRDGLDRTVGWALRLRSVDAHAQWMREKDGKTAGDAGNSNKEKSESEKKVEALLELGGDLIDALENMADHQSYLREREAAHRALAEETFSAVLFWTVVEALVLASVAGAQIFYLRRFIEKRRYL